MKHILLAIVAIGGLLVSQTAAKADFQLRYNVNGGGFVVVTDNSASDNDKTTGSISVTTLGGLSITASFGGSVSKQETQFDLSVNGNSLTGKLTVIVDATITDINTAPPPQTLSYQFTGSLGTKATGTQTFQTWIDNNNNPFGGAAGIVGTDIVADTTGKTIPASGAITFSANAALYSATTEVNVNVASSTGLYGISNDSNNDITPGPVPASLVLALSGIPILAFGAWLRRKPIIAEA